MRPVVRRVHERCHDHIHSVELEGRQRVVPVLLVEREAGEDRLSGHARDNRYPRGECGFGAGLSTVIATGCSGRECTGTAVKFSG
jgi:hypothetical protein